MPATRCCLPGILFATTLAFAAQAELAVPALTGRINDYAAVLSDEQVRMLDELLARHERSTSNQIVVLTIPSLEDDVLEPFANRVFNTWRLGDADKDNGVLLLLSRDEGRIRIEVGLGLEGDLTDIEAGSIIRGQIKPLIAEGRFGDGIAAGVEAIVAAIEGSYTADQEPAGGSSTAWVTVFLGVLGALLAYASASFYLNRKPKLALATGYFGFVLLLAVLGVTIGIALLAVYTTLLLAYRFTLHDTAAGEALVRRWNWYAGGTAAASATGPSRDLDDYWLHQHSNTYESADEYSGGGGESGGGGASDH